MKLEVSTGFLGLLTLVFIVGKMMGWIDWSWWIVFSPLIVYAAFWIFIIIVIGIIILVAAIA